MNDLDAQIRAALKAEDAEILSAFDGDSPIHEDLIQLYQGRRRWLNVVAMIGTFALFIALLVCAYQFFQVESTQMNATRSLIGWATGFLAIFMWLVLMKLWFWLELLKNSVTREVKRLELQVALLNKAREQ